MPQAPAAVRAAYAVFRRPAAQRDLLPPARTKHARSVVARFVTRRISGTVAAHDRAWAIVRDDKLCTSVELPGGGGGGCSPLRTTDGRAPWTFATTISQRRVDTPPTRARIIALLPDGTHDVRRTAADGTVTAVQIHGNAIDETFTREAPARLTWVWVDGTTADPFNGAAMPPGLMVPTG